MNYASMLMKDWNKRQLKLFIRNICIIKFIAVFENLQMTTEKSETVETTVCTQDVITACYSGNMQ